MSEETKEEIKNEKVDEEVTEELTEEALEDIVEEEINELDEAQKLATEWENKFLRVSAEMQNVQRRGNKKVLNCFQNFVFIIITRFFIIKYFYIFHKIPPYFSAMEFIAYILILSYYEKSLTRLALFY